MLIVVLSLIGCGGEQPTEDKDPRPKSPPTEESPEEVATYSISGSVSGSRHDSVTLQLNGSESLTLNPGDSSFSFSTELETGESYSVAVSGQQSSPSVVCTVSSGSGSVSTSDVSDVAVICPSPVFLQVASEDSTIAVSTATSVSALGYFSDGSFIEMTSFVSWSVSDAAVLSLSAASEVTGLGAGGSNVVASFSGVSAQRYISVVSGSLVSLEISPNNPALSVGDSLQMSATGIYDSGSSQDLTAASGWSSSDSAVVSVSSTGQVSALASGSATLQASYGAVTQTMNLTVDSETLQSIEISPVLFTGATGDSQSYSVVGIYSDSSVRDLTDLASFSSGDLSKATFSNEVASFVGAGGVTLTAFVSSISAVAVANISSATLQSITITPGSATIAQGFEQQYTATGYYSDSSTADITSSVLWTSSDTSVLQVSNSVEDKGLALAVSGGLASLTASLSGVTAIESVEVSATSLASIEIVPSEMLISKGINVPFQALGTFSDGSVLDVTDRVLWSSSDNSVALMLNSPGSEGVMDNIYTGSDTEFLTVTASLDGATQDANVIVTPASLDEIV
ncbi:MAG: Ig-like domain-containing protein, partial [Bdellovibrionales bacterium]|nr:Ig-like domain-containing protein [Bdellovibrionales bacterium]